MNWIICGFNIRVFRNRNNNSSIAISGLVAEHFSYILVDILGITSLMLVFKCPNGRVLSMTYILKKPIKREIIHSGVYAVKLISLQSSRQCVGLLDVWPKFKPQEFIGDCRFLAKTLRVNKITMQSSFEVDFKLYGRPLMYKNECTQYKYREKLGRNTDRRVVMTNYVWVICMYRS